MSEYIEGLGCPRCGRWVPIHKMNISEVRRRTFTISTCSVCRNKVFLESVMRDSSFSDADQRKLEKRLKANIAPVGREEWALFREKLKNGGIQKASEFIPKI